MILSPKGLFILNELEKQTFISVIKEFSDASTLAHPQSNYTKYKLVTNSCNYAVGAAFHQIVESGEGNQIWVGFF